MMHTSSNSSTLWLMMVSVAVVLACSGVSLAQTKTPSPPPRSNNPLSAEKSSPSDDGPPMTTFEEEMRAKRLIRLAEKEHQQNLERAREISQLAKDLQQTFKTTNTLDREGLKRLERLEKLTKKIRGEAGGEDAKDVEIANRPSDKASTIGQIAEAAESLSKAVQNTPRQVVSTAVIDGANVLLELITIFRTYTQ